MLSPIVLKLMDVPPPPAIALSRDRVPNAKSCGSRNFVLLHIQCNGIHRVTVIGIKCCPIFPKVAAKVNTAAFTSKFPQKLPSIWAKFLSKFLTKASPKSGRTE